MDIIIDITNQKYAWADFPFPEIDGFHFAGMINGRVCDLAEPGADMTLICDVHWQDSTDEPDTIEYELVIQKQYKRLGKDYLFETTTRDHKVRVSEDQFYDIKKAADEYQRKFEDRITE
jgi:hypothetical protein